MKRVLLFAVLMICAIPAFATTWYVRPDGGTRYSANETNGQCNGMFNAAYPGKGVNQNCAFNDVRYLWTDGSYTVNANAGAPAWGWIGAGGDTYLIDCPNDCRVGQNGPNAANSFGLANNPSQAGAPPPLNGTASAHTKILGVNFANCTADGQKAHINGGYGVRSVFSFANSSYIDVACLNITDHSNCGLAGQVNACSQNYPLSDYAMDGIKTNASTTNVTFTDVRVHGMAVAGMVGATGTGVSLNRVALVGNASAGWNMNDGSGVSGSGTLSLNSLSLLWNGCAEEYPIVDAEPYQDCTDVNSGGYGDGLVAPPAASNPAWTVTVTNSIAAYNTQVGFDLLPIEGNGSVVTLSNSLAYGNMSFQLEAGAGSTTKNDLIIGSCNALRQPIVGTLSGYNSRLSAFCYNGDAAVAINVQDASPTVYQANTLYSANTSGVVINCNGACTAKSTIEMQNNVFFGFTNNAGNGYTGGGNGSNPMPIVLNVAGLFSNAGSVLSHNSTFNPSAKWTCPSAQYNEAEAICGDPKLSDESWHLYGYGQMAPVPTSPVVGAGASINGLTVDYLWNSRPTPPAMGALEHGSALPGEQINLQASPSPATVNQPVTLTATVVNTDSKTPTGTIKFMNGNTSLGTAALNNAGTATLGLGSMAAGSYSIVGVYSGDSNYAAGTSGVAPLQVLITTTTTLAAAPNPSTFGQSVTLTATVKSTGAGIPAGNVTFLNGSTVLGTSALNASGVATLGVASLAGGSYTLTAQYAGNASFSGSASAGAALTVKAQATSTSLTAAPNPVDAGQAVTLTATVKGSGSATPAGSVNFLSGSTLLGSAALNASGVATLSNSTLAAGSYSLTAQFVANASNLASTSAAAALTVVKPLATTTTLAVTPNPSAYGQSVTMTATVKVTGAGTAAGSVSFVSGSTVLGTSNLNASGVATFVTAALSGGSYSVTAQYAGNVNFVASNSAAVTVTVNAVATTTSLVAAPSPATFGQSVTLTATVKASGNSTPSGSVNFLSGSTVLGSGSLNAAGVATLSTATLAAGANSLTAQFAANANYLASTSAVDTLTVSKQSTTTVLASSSNPIVAGQTLTLTATITGSGSVTPTGTVNFFSGSTSLGTATVGGAGAATLTTSFLAGSYTLTAQYQGDANSLASTSANYPETVSPAPTSGPVVLYTDQLSGPNSGGENNNGTYLTIFGTNFGASQGTSTVTINGKAVAQYLVWSNTKIGVQVGPVTTGPIVVKVGGVSSNNNFTFTVRAGKIYFIGPAVDNSAPPSCAAMLASNSYATPWGLTNYASTTEANYNWKTMRTPFTYYNCISLGDTLVFLNGVSYPYFDGYGWHSSITPNKFGATASSFVSFIARPGAKAQLGGTGWATFAFRDTSNGYNVVSGLTLTGSGPNGGSQFGAYNAGNVGNRVVGNEMTCPDCSGPAGAVMASDGFVMYGNTVDKVSTLLSTGSNKTYHAVYVDGNNIEIGWNKITNTLAYNGIQINHDGISGFYNQSYHDNDISDVNGSGINLSTIDPSSGYIKVFNNVIHHVGVNAASDGGAWDPHSCLAVKGYGTATGAGTIQFYNNTMYDCSSYLNTVPNTGASCALLVYNGQPSATLNLVNNIVYQPTYSGTSLENVYICAGGGALGPMTGSNNIWYSDSNPGGTAPAKNYGVIENPQFVSNINYSLQKTSPAVGAGMPFQGLTWDFNAATRSNPPAIGAFE